jgi:selenocysteine lyase/cysteine desulfurase
MTTRRHAIKVLGLSAVSLPAFGSVSYAPSLPLNSDPDYWAKLRDQFSLSKDTVFFNTGTVGAMPKVVVQKMIDHLQYVASNVADWAYVDDNKEEFISGYNNLIGIRTKVGKLINGEASCIAMTDNVTNGISYVANGLDLSPGDEVLTSNQEHSGGQSGFMLKAKRHGTTFRTVAIEKPAKDSKQIFEAVMNSVGPRTRVIMLSHMITGSGAIVPVKEICAAARQRQIFSIIDGAQTVGQIKVDVRDIGCDAYAGCFHKWMGAPAGTGFLYVRPDKISEIWTTVASTRWDNHDDEGFRFTQRGTGNFPVLKGLEASIDFHNEIGPDRVYERIKFLGQRLRTGLRKINKVKIFSPADESICAGITTYKVEGLSGKQLQDAFWEKGRMRPRAQGDFGVRHCTHIFNSEGEIDEALKIVASL